MTLKEMRKIVEAYKKVKEKMDPVGQADADINNDGNVDSSDEYLRNRRRAIGKAMKKESSCGKMRKEEKVECPKCKGKGCSHCDDTGYHMKEEVEQVDELKKSTLRNYGNKAQKDVHNKVAKAWDYPAGHPAIKKNLGAAERRSKMIKLANKKMGEEVELFSEKEINAMIDAGVFEASRADHYKSATPAETMKDQYKGKAADDMAADHNAHSPKHADITPEEEGHKDSVKAGRATKQSAPRGGADKLSSGASKTPEKLKKVK